MMNIKIIGSQQRIEALYAKAKSEPVQADTELQAQIARFLCVLCSGLIEQAVKSCLDEYARSRSHPRVARYVSKGVLSLRNAKFEDILNILGRFDPAWREYFDANTPDEVRDAIDSIVNNRNQIAHGEQVTVSLAVFDQYHKGITKFLNDLDKYISTQ